MSAFASGLRGQVSPELDEYPRFDVDIVSAELPCGSAWLVNCLLELDVPVWKPWNANVPGEWASLGARRYRYACADLPWQRTLPALQLDRVFAFRERPVPRVQHAWPGANPATAQTIFFVRDPRDALYSAWQRQRRMELIAADVDFVKFADSRYFHYPLSWSEYPLLFLRLWRAALRERGHLLLRFEDYRADANATLQRATEFLGVRTTASALQLATERSDFSALQALEVDLIQQGKIDASLNRAGRAYEYRTTFDAAMHAVIGPRYKDLFAWLGYAMDVPGAVAQAASAIQDIEPLLRAMLVDQFDPLAQVWLRDQVAIHTRDIALDRWPALT
jgi:Sulfotransferase domain